MSGPRTERDRRLLYAAGFLRAVGVGMTGILLGVGLAKAGFDNDEIGTVVAAGLLGGAAATLLVALKADRLGRKRALAGIAVLTAAGGWGVAFGSSLTVLVLCAFFGMANGMGRDRAAAFTLEQAIVPSTTAAARRTGAFAMYALVLDVGHAVGAFLASLPWVLRGLGLDEEASYRVALAVAATLNLGSLAAYALLSPAVESAPRVVPLRLSPRTRGIVGRFAAISAVDSLGGGFITQALVSAWFLARFGAGEEILGPLFAAGQAAHMLSYGGAVLLSRRIGLVNTMVFTHLPAHLLLMAMAFAPSLPIAILLLMLRECLVEMDVPTRTAYITSVVGPEERTAATGITNVARVAAWSLGPKVAGHSMEVLSSSAPFFIGGGIKIVYDLVLWRTFRKVLPEAHE